MSIIGTRPPLISETNLYELHHRARLAIKPGITGMWQVSGRSDITDFEEVVRLDKEYIENWNIGLDIKILLKTVVSFLCFIVLSGKGELSYEGQTYKLSEGDCVFIDCRKAYSHSTSDNLWSLQWCHFYAPSLPAVYEKYKERGGRPVFHSDDLASFTSILTDLYDLASSADYIRDMFFFMLAELRESRKI